MSALVLVTVGSDHHPFDRLVQYADRWAAAHPQARVVVQYGTSAAPTTAEGESFLAHQQLQQLMAEATAIVTQGGPTGIAEARRNGRLPIVVPRQHGLGEHVDDHQRAFARFLSEGGAARVAESEADFTAALAAALSEDPENVVDPEADAAEVAATVERFGALIATLRPRSRRRQNSKASR